jgi:peptidoglycan/LPS O-acetylase OafA/YrhL
MHLLSYFTGKFSHILALVQIIMQQTTLTVGQRDRICAKYWWVNFLYFTNLYPRDPSESGTNSCAGWNWYLVNDMQFFLLVPFLIALYRLAVECRERYRGDISSWKVKIRQFLEIYGPCIALVFIQIVVTIHIMEKYHLKNHYDNDFHYYTLPWVRISPYAIGVALAILHNERLSQPQWKKFTPSSRVDLGLFLLAFGNIFLIMMLMYDQSRCKADKHDCQVWFARVWYGFRVSNNWDHKHFLTVAFASLKFMSWGLSLAYISYFFMRERGGTIRYLLSGSVWTPLARLTYNAYLLHLPFENIFYGVMKAQTFFSWEHYLQESLAFSVGSYLASYLIFLLIEKPILNLTTMSLKRERTLEHANGNDLGA